jgi:transposase
MRYIRGITKETLKILKRIEKESKYPQVRKRALCIQLSYEGWEIKELIKILKVTRNTIYNWFNDWENYQLIGLYNRKGKGRKCKLNDQEKEIVKQWVKESPKKLEKVKEKIKKEWRIEISKETIKRIIKEKKMGWYRVKRRVKGYPDEEEYKEKKKEIKKLQEKEKRGEIDIYYVDETGFCLTPYIPYAWQESQERIEIKSSRSKRLNVLGFLNKSNDLESYIFNCSINSEVVVACIDKFSEGIKKKHF